MGVTAESVWCYADDCIVDFGFTGLPVDNFVENPLANSCGGADRVNSFYSQNGYIGQSNYSLKFVQNKTQILRTCNPLTLPSQLDGFQNPVSSIVINKHSIPGRVQVVLRDRGAHKRVFATVSVGLPPPPHCETRIQPRAGEISFKNISLQKHSVKTFCFDTANTNFESRPFYEFHTTNLSNAQCSALMLKAISPSGREYVGSSWQPGTSGRGEPGLWYIQLFLYEGCNRYNISVQ